MEGARGTLHEVLADLGDLFGLAAMRAQVLDEALVSGGVAAGRDVDRGAPVKVGEHGE